MKVLRCTDIGFQCGFVAGCEDTEVCIRLCEVHAKESHNASLTSQKLRSLRECIQEV